MLRLFSWRFITIVIAQLAGTALAATDRPDVLIADFEGADYGLWCVTGDAFGARPAQGTLPQQMGVSGFLGKGLVNSFQGGDATTGTLTSPPFEISRKYLNFLIGGGHHPTETCINLLVDGKVARSATGPAAGGGNERLDWQTWDVQDLAGRQAVLEIVDRHTGGWGHVNVDQISLGDVRQAAEPAHRELKIDEQYLNLPVRTGDPMRHVRLLVDGKVIREFDIELADKRAADAPGEQNADNEAPLFWVSSDLTQWQGKLVRIEVDALPAGSHALASVTIDDEPRSTGPVYHERLRPQFHFTSQRGWLNDPNGLVYSDGAWHLFYQHNPYGWNWGNMHWGHAVSDDLIQWREMPIALYPQRYGDWCFSGSAVVDHDNTSGLKKGEGDLLVAAYTSTGRGECITYSNDAGRTWTEYPGNPVVRHQGRDPKLIWHAETKRWVMAVYDEAENKRWIAFYTSPDLKKWEFASRIAGFFECPDLFELEVDGNPGTTHWVLYGADGRYMLGQFDGRTFTPVAEKKQLWHGNFYAAQTYSDTPDQRRVQIGWGQGITFPEMPFNQQMTIPVELTLRNTSDGVRMCAWPVEEIDSLRAMLHAFADAQVKPGENPLEDIRGELFDIEADIDLGDCQSCSFNLRGQEVKYDVGRGLLICGKHSIPVAAPDKNLRLRLLIDRGSLEIFAQQGLTAVSLAMQPEKQNRTVAFSTYGGSARLRSLTVCELRSAW